MAATLDARLRLNSAEFTGGLNRAVRESHAAISKMSAQFGTLKNVLTGGALGVGAGMFISDSLGKAAEYEKYTRMLSLVSGGVNAAKVELAELKKEALRPGLDLESAVTAAVRLRTMGYASEEARKHMVALSNKVAAFGGGGEEMKGVLIALSQIAAKGKVSAEEINQIAERMPGIREDMKAAFGTADTEQLQKMGIDARTFIDTILNRWSDAPEVVSGISEEMKNLRMTMDGLKAYAGNVFSNMLPPMLEFLRGLTAVHAIATDTLDTLMGGGMARQRDAQRFAAEMEQKAADAGIIKKRTAEEEEAAEKKRAEMLKKRSDEVREFQRRRDETAALGRQMLQTDEEELEVVRKQLEEFTDLELIISEVNRAYQNQNEISDELLEKYRRGVALKREEAQLIDAINRKEAERIDKEVDNELKTPKQRKDDRKRERERERAERRVFRREEREALRKAEREERQNRIDNIKRGNFFDKDEARKRIRKDQAERWTNALKESAQSLKNIERILGNLATA